MEMDMEMKMDMELEMKLREKRVQGEKPKKPTRFTTGYSRLSLRFMSEKTG